MMPIARRWNRLRGWGLRSVGLVLLVILLIQVDYHQVLQVLRGADLWLVAGAMALIFPLIWLKTVRWQRILRSQAVLFRTGPALLSYFGSLFIGFLTPGRLGEFVKALHVSQDCNVPSARAFSTVLTDRLFDLYALLLVGGVALLTLPAGDTQVLAVMASATALIAPLILFLNPATFGWIQRIGLKWKGFGQKLLMPGGWLSEMRDGVRQLTWNAIVVAIILTVLAYLVFFGQCYLLARALRLEVDFIAVSYAVALGSLITLLPISISGLGTREATMIAYLGTQGVAPESALGFSLLVFMTFYLGGGLIGAVAWWLKPAPLVGQWNAR